MEYYLEYGSKTGIEKKKYCCKNENGAGCNTAKPHFTWFTSIAPAKLERETETEMLKWRIEIPVSPPVI